MMISRFIYATKQALQPERLRLGNYQVFGTIQVRGHTFFPSALGQTAVVVDLGGNVGEFSRMIRARFNCRCVSIEPNPLLVDRLRTLGGVEVEWAAVADHDGQIELHLSDNAEASTAFSGSSEANGQRISVPARTLEGLFTQFGLTHVDLMKVDIEGSEIAMLLSSPAHLLRCIDQITIEFHDFCHLSTSAEVEAACSRLRELNFDEIRFGSGNEDTLFVRRDAKAVGLVHRACVKHVGLNTLHTLNRLRRVPGRVRRMIGAR